MRVDLFDFDLPDESIALRPVSPRDHARMLVIQPDGSPALQDERVHDPPAFLRPGDALVFNAKRILSAHLERQHLHEGAGEPPMAARHTKRADTQRGKAPPGDAK